MSAAEEEGEEGQALSPESQARHGSAPRHLRGGGHPSASMARRTYGVPHTQSRSVKRPFSRSASNVAKDWMVEDRSSEREAARIGLRRDQRVGLPAS